MRIVVDLPAPLGPKKPKMSPFSTLKETESAAFIKPKDLVSGDFYWLYESPDYLFFATVDCTGHGVAGAFMSIVGHNLLNDIVKRHENYSPAEILSRLDKAVISALHQNSENAVSRDGMDISLCKYDKKSGLLYFSGAMNSLYIAREGELMSISPDKYSIGMNRLQQSKNFTNHTITLEPKDTLYLYSDGFADQLGGPNGTKKFMYPKLRRLLLENTHLPMPDQRKALEKAFYDWKGNEEQVEDVLLLGVRLLMIYDFMKVNMKKNDVELDNKVKTTDLYIEYRGPMTVELIDGFIFTLDNRLDLLDEKLTFKRKIFGAVTEALQNIIRHAYTKYPTATYKCIEDCMFYVEYKDGSCHVKTENLIENKQIESFSTWMGKINEADKDQVLELYKERLKNGMLSEKGGAGIGLLEIARKSKEKLQFSFAKKTGSYSKFTFSFSIA
jgi:hypothetical protein